MYVQSVYPVRFSVVFPPLPSALQYPVLKGVALRILGSVSRAERKLGRGWPTQLKGRFLGDLFPDLWDGPGGAVILTLH